MSGLFGRNRPVYLDASGYRRKRSIPPWIPVILAGAAIGAGGVLYWQQQGPQRLTFAESALVQTRAERAEAELRRTSTELGDALRKLEAEQAGRAQAEAAATSARGVVTALKQDLALLSQLLPPDPRGGVVGVRTARFTVQGTSIGWIALLTRESANSQRSRNLIEVTVTGRGANGRDEVVTPEPGPIVFEGAYLRAQGSVTLPDGFTARQATVRVLEAEGGKTLGTRTFYIR